MAQGRKRSRTPTGDEVERRLTKLIQMNHGPLSAAEALQMVQTQVLATIADQLYLIRQHLEDRPSPTTQEADDV